MGRMRTFDGSQEKIRKTENYRERVASSELNDK